jgi:hypothetical protein
MSALILVGRVAGVLLLVHFFSEQFQDLFTLALIGHRLEQFTIVFDVLTSDEALHGPSPWLPPPAHSKMDHRPVQALQQKSKGAGAANQSAAYLR